MMAWKVGRKKERMWQGVFNYGNNAFGEMGGKREKGISA